MIDADHFKKINDTYGHQFGDVVLKKVSDIIQESIRGMDIAGRYGGEEFMVILPEISISGGVIAAERIRTGVENLKVDDKPVKVTVSLGVAEYCGEDLQGIVKKVDHLLYKAKELGRNCIES